MCSILSPVMTSAPFLPPLWLTDGELYAGVYIDFMGTDSSIFRTMGKQTIMRTDQYNSRWLNGNVSNHGLLYSQHNLFQSSFSRLFIIYSSAPEKNVAVMFQATSHMYRRVCRLFLELCCLGIILLIFPSCATWPHLTQSIKCTTLIIDRMPQVQ